MISLERKEEIIAEVTYAVDRCISKQSIISTILEDLLSDAEREWFNENCFGNYIIECGDFK